MSMRASEPAEPPLPDFSSLCERFGLLRGEAAKCSPVERRGAFACDCAACARWHAFVAGRPHADDASGCADGAHPRYEVFTAEHVAALAAYLLERRAAYADACPLRVLEVGAGDGRLQHHLSCALQRLGGSASAVQLTATDSDERGLRAASPFASLVRVAPCDAQLLEAERPDLIIACWQPFGVDWTAMFRACASVREYVLIGEADDGICGRPWETWGCRAPGDEDGSESSSEEKGESRAARPLAPYEADGFVRVDLPGLSRWQLCRTDERWRSRGASRTVAFRRRDPAGLS
jgi:hypothetical protein